MPTSKINQVVGDSDLVKEDWTIFAIYVQHSTETYTINLTVSPSGGGYTEINGSIKSSATVEQYSNLIEAVPKEGYVFVKWSDDNTNKKRNVTGNVTLTAIFKADESEMVTVRFYNHNGTNRTLISEQTVVAGKSPVVPDDPTLDGWTFNGWSGSPDAGQPVTADTDYTAKWKASFDASGTLESGNISASYARNYMCTIPEGCTMKAEYDGTLRHTASPTTHRAKFTLFAVSDAGTQTTVDKWDEIYTSKAKDEFDVGGGLVSSTTIPSDRTKLKFYANKLEDPPCGASWIASITVVAYMN